MAGANFIPDGNDEIIAEMPLIIELIARTARWVHPDAFRQLPVWSPWAARGLPVYDKTWSRRYTNTRRATKQTSEKVEGNIAAAGALIAALGVARQKPANWTVCHIWGYDDPAYRKEGSIVRDRRYFSCTANMVWLPTPLKGFTDALPQVKTMLRTCAFYLYDWACEAEGVREQADSIRGGTIPDGYPKSWPCSIRPGLLPTGTAPFTSGVEAEIRKQKSKIRSLLADETLTYFPREEVRQVLTFWKIDLTP